MSVSHASKKRGPAPPVEQSESDEEEDERLFSDDEGTNIDGIYIPPVQPPTLSMDPTGPRLIITKINNRFFKSYAEDQVLGPFHKCFNAIVGPNGSGKSNVIDSLLFVFGYRATKIRCKKVSVLLHNSDNYHNIQSCTVTIHFALIVDKEGDEYDVVPGSEFVISRTACRDNSSYYELDNKRVQFKEVAVLLKKHGIDLDHNRFLILQGEVEQISMMKCKGEKDGETGMLEYLEDIIGTTRYKKPLEQVFNRVEELTERRIEKLNRLKMVQDEVDELQGPMEEAVGFLKVENTVVRSKNFIYQYSIKDVKLKSQAEQEAKEEVLEIQNQYKERLQILTQEKQNHCETQDKEAAIYENLKKKKEDLKDAFDKASKKDVQLQEEMTSKNNARKKTKGQIVAEKEKLLRLENVPNENAKLIKEIEDKLEKTMKEKEVYEAEKSTLMLNIQRTTKGLQEQKESLQGDLALLQEEVDKTKAGFTLAETELKVCLSNEENERQKLEQLKHSLIKSEETIIDRSKQIQILKQQLPEAKKQLETCNRELLQLIKEEDQLIAVVRKQRATLEEGRSCLQASKSTSRVLDSLMNAKREGKCPGLFGRLGDLGAIDAKYDVAVSTACGPLDNIVVDSVDCAQWCIEYLKQNDIGRAVFIALDKQEHLRNKACSRIQTPENVHRLFDLIKMSDERVKTAFYYALRDTLVAEDLEQASRIAYGTRRYRVVTLKGDLIETSGTMSGGGKRVLRGRMGQSVAVANLDPRDLKRQEDEVERIERRVRELRTCHAELENRISELQPEIREMEINFEKYKHELQSLQVQQPNLQRQMKEQEAKSKGTKADAAQVQKLTRMVESRKEEYEAASEAAGELQEKVDKITNEIKEKSTGKLKIVDKKIKECTKIVDMCKSEIIKLNVAVKTAKKNYESTEENIARLEQDLKDMENSLRAMKKQREEIEEEAKKMLLGVEEVTEALEEREQVFREARKAVEKITKEETKLRSEKIDVDDKLKVLQKKIREYEGVVNSFKHKLSQLKLQEVPNMETEELEQYSDEALTVSEFEKAEKEMQQAENFLKAAKPNLGAIQEYRKKQKIYLERASELEEIVAKRTQMRSVHDDLKKRRKEEFVAGYNVIKLKLKEMYQMITLGGDAEFEMVDTYDPFTEGIQFIVRPPRKTWKKISNLSGGEKTLSSLALVFALHYYKPSPLYVMDEIDAALDFKNVSIVGNYIKERTKNAQFIIISLRSNMFELCDNLVGIYKTYNTTKTITFNPTVYDVKPQQHEVAENRNVTGDENNKNIAPVECLNGNDSNSRMENGGGPEEALEGQNDEIFL
ncbi:structural maintenance of chromosomes protein 4 isoform X2 [Euwallacea fornicatus]|uniref:structural maintenance of chromosomes protein 4 isoform X2 n=1 Tax=Euwallacea fornicatus TaxID=995702 RepID=UPI00338E3A7F